ncbi:MAG TPA: chromate efflux transporter [Solirubrobacteraceae bacterium]|nr:chromate efflux transporter [Solirubrobacteraceae bacterium]
MAREWTRIGVTGFGGPPAHVALLRGLVVEREGWIGAREFEDAYATCGLLPGPASTQLAIYCALRVAGRPGAVLGGLGFVLPSVVLILLLSVLFLARTPPDWVRGAGAGAGAAVAAVAVHAGRGLLGPSWRRARAERARELRWLVWVAAGIAGAVVVGPYLVVVLLACGLAEVVLRRPRSPSLSALASSISVPALARTAAAGVSGGFGALAWTALKVGALSFGGGFVIVPLMQGDAVHSYHWMTNTQFLNAVALGQVTPGPVVATVAAVGYAAHGLAGGLVAAAIAFAPSFGFVLGGGRAFLRLRDSARARAFLDGAGPAAIGAILGSAIALAGAIQQGWQAAILAAAALFLLVLRRGVVATLLAAGAAGAIVALAGGPLP